MIYLLSRRSFNREDVEPNKPPRATRTRELHPLLISKSFARKALEKLLLQIWAELSMSMSREMRKRGKAVDEVKSVGLTLEYARGRRATKAQESDAVIRSRSHGHEYKSKQKRESTRVQETLEEAGVDAHPHSDSRQESSRYIENHSESEDSEGGHWKSKLRRKKSSVEDDDLSQLGFVAEKTDRSRKENEASRPEENVAINDEVSKLVAAGIMREVHYHDWLSNPVMVKKSDNSWRMCVDFKTQQACPIGRLSLPEKKRNRREVESLFGFLQSFLDEYKGVLTKYKWQRMMRKRPRADGPVDKEFHDQFGEHLEDHIVKLPMRHALEATGRKLIGLLAASKEAVSAVLMTKREARHMPIYFISRALRGPEETSGAIPKEMNAPDKVRPCSWTGHLALTDTEQEIDSDLGEIWAVQNLEWLDYYFDQVIEAKPVAKLIIGNQSKKLYGKHSVQDLVFLGETYIRHGKQFRANPFSRLGVEKLCIQQHFASVKHPQMNGLVERANMSLGEGIKARLGKDNKNWLEEISHVLWAHRTLIKSSNGGHSFSLLRTRKSYHPAEIRMPKFRDTADSRTSVEIREVLEINLELLEEKREQAAIREAKKQKANGKILQHQS
ncbi:reverse transcriptase domain-containing protein [Tanacetum coccineum]